MRKTSTKFLVCFFLLTVFTVTKIFAQTITIGNIDPGPYAQGSTITIPFHVDNASGCIGQNNTYQLFMSNAAGVFASNVPVATISSFYAPFFNYKVSAGIAPGTNYKFQIRATSPAVSSAASNAVTVVAGTGVQAAATSLAINSNYTDVFGFCDSNGPATFTFTDRSTPGSVVTASFFNELTQTYEAQNVSLSQPYDFSANAANYTVTIKAVNGGIVSTYSYELLNNKVNSNIGSSQSASACLNNGSAIISFVVATANLTGNYPGLTYKVTWGDGTSTVYTVCDLISSNGTITHEYTQPSCGLTAHNNANSFEVDLLPMNPYCGNVGTNPTEYAKVLTKPTTGISGPNAGCSNNSITFRNISQPGPDANATQSSCTNNPNALYSWYVDGVLQAANVKLTASFNYTFTTPGTHTILLKANQNGFANCNADDATHTICIQDPPVVKFTLPASPVCIASGPVSPDNQSQINQPCNNTNNYIWTVTGPAPVSYANGTSASSQTPQFVFSQPGVYSIQLGILTATCGRYDAPAQQLVVNDAPVAKLSPSFNVCGNNITYTFDNTSGSPTQTTLTGSAQNTPGTYQWTVTSANGGTYSFANGTSATDQYPQIHFDSFDTYTITVTQTNNCGTQTSQPQKITFAQAPTVSAGAVKPIAICQGDVAHLQGSITPATNNNVTSFSWTGGNGTFSNGRNSLITDYTPTAAEISAGQVTLTLSVNTTLPVPCNNITDNITIQITPTDVVTSQPSKSICSGSPVGYNITASNANSTFAWTAALTSGSATGFNNGSGATINDVITSGDPTRDAVVTYTIAPTSNGCAGTPFVFKVTIHALPTVTISAANNPICSGNAAGLTLTSSIPGTTYTWTATAPGNISGYSNQSTPTSTTSIQDVLINSDRNLSSQVHYVVTPYNADNCPGTPVPYDLTVTPAPVQAHITPIPSQCNITSYQLQGNDPTPGTGKWTVLPAAGVTFDDDTKPNAVISGLQPGTVYQVKWTITSGFGCPSTSDQVTISDNPQTQGGTTSSTDPTTVCANSNSGTIQLNGQVGVVLHWESSTDNGSTWQSIPSQSAALVYNNLAVTTQFRAVVQSGGCAIATSTPITITVNPSAPQASTGAIAPLCNQTQVTLTGNDPGAFQGVWTQTGGPAAVITNPNQYNSTVTGLVGGNTYTFVWTINGIAPCLGSSSTLTVIDKADVTPSFTASVTEGCGDLVVNFTNTSNNQAGATFLWDFGDGTPQSNDVNPQHTFAGPTTGHDATYQVQLSVVDNCVVHPAAVQTITVHPANPVAGISMDQTSFCNSPVTITVHNTSPGNNQQYEFYLFDGNNMLFPPVIKQGTDKSDAVFGPITVTGRKTFVTYMVVTDKCGTTNESPHIPITVTPPDYKADFVIASADQSQQVSEGCAPLDVTLINNSTGGDSFTYNVYDQNQQYLYSIGGTFGALPHTFDTPGTFYLQLVASSSCGPVQSALKRLVIDPLPAPDFTADNTSGCKDLTVNFTNLTPTDPSQSLTYSWDFGDGTQSSLPQPSHAFNYNGSPFTVTLTVTNNATHCVSQKVKQGYITVNAPPSAAFTERPGPVVKIPDYHFSFIDETTGGAASWLWDFGDNSTPSTAQNPEHTYADTGTYKVTLTVKNSFGCDSTVTGYVQVTGVPGQLYLPNAFMPSSATTELRTFMAKGSGIAQWHLQIFNNYGELVWETTKLDGRGAPVEGWDGTYKGQQAPQGVYVWQASAVFINGTTWKGMSYGNSPPKRTGSVHLIR